MNCPSLEELLLNDVELEMAKMQVQEMAYHKWHQAGCPIERDLDFWRDAELEWIEYYYVPDRLDRRGLSATCESGEFL